MRMRKKKHGAERLAVCSEIISEKPTVPHTSGDLIFPHKGELHLEIGCGKGGFICQMAEKHPDINFFAFEKMADAVVIAAEKAMAMSDTRSNDNLRFAVGDAQVISEWFAPKSIDTLYLNFSDPWPKKKHAKRRLTYRTFLRDYFALIKDGGYLKFKTDNRALFEFTLSELAELGTPICDLTFDLHNSVYAKDNVVTEYEKNFSEKGFAINMLTIRVSH